MPRGVGRLQARTPARRLGHSPIKIPNRATQCGVHSGPLTTILTTVPILNSVSDKHACTDAPWNRGHRSRPKTPVDASKQAHYELLNRCRGYSLPWVRIPPLPPATNPLYKRVFAFPQCAVLRSRGPLPRTPADRRMGLKQSKYTAESDVLSRGQGIGRFETRPRIQTLASHVDVSYSRYHRT
jgi:hypothetical protein